MKNTTHNTISAQKVTGQTKPVVASNSRELKHMTAEKCAAVYAAAFEKLEATRHYLAEN